MLLSMLSAAVASTTLVIAVHTNSSQYEFISVMSFMVSFVSAIVYSVKDDFKEL